MEINPSKSNKKSQPPNQEDYFSFQSNTRTPTKPLTKVTLKEILGTVKELSHEGENVHESFRKSLVDEFNLYLSELQLGLNLVFYGFGSKRSILCEFANFCGSYGPSLECSGHLPSTFHLALKSILEKILRSTHLGQSIGDSCSLIENAFRSNDGPENMYLIIHNIDAKQFQSPTAQNIIERLSQIHQIHIIASVDMINAPLLRSINPSSSNWLFHQVDTYEKYESEVKDMSQLAEKLSSVDSTKQVNQFNVISSLPQKVKTLFFVLAQHFLENPQSTGLIEGEYFELAKKEVFGIDQKGFQGLLLELLEHKIILKKIYKRNHVYSTSLSNELLRELCDELQTEKT